MIFKIKKIEPPYTQIHNNIIDNPTLSGKAKWILIYLLSKPGDWQVVEVDIKNHCTDGRDSIRSGVHELMLAGYIKRGQRQRNELGQVKAYTYEVYEIPIKQTRKACDGFPYVGKPAVSNINNSSKKKNLPAREERYQIRHQIFQDIINQAQLTGYGLQPDQNDDILLQPRHKVKSS